MNRQLKSFIFTSVLFLLGLCSCGKESSGSEIFTETELQQNSTYDWLNSHSNFHKEKYYSVFNHYYSHKLKEKDFSAAALALKAVTEQEIYFLSFDSTFLATVESFDALYSSHLHWSETLFIDSYRGNHWIDLGEYRKAIACFSKVAKYKPYDYTTFVESGYMYSDLAYCYAAIGDQEKAMKFNNKALAYFSRTDNLAGKGSVYDHMALVNLFTKNYAETERYFGKAMQVYTETEDTNSMFITLHNKILLYDEINNPKKNKLIDSTYRLFVSSGMDDPSLEVALCSFYVEKLLNEGKTEKAKEVLQDMEIMVEELKSPTSYGDYQISLAEYEIATGTGILNIKLIEEALLAVEESEDFQNQLAFLEILKADALLKKDYKKALMYAEKEKIAQNNLANREMVVKSMELNKKHQTERKEQQIALQAKRILSKNIAIALLLTALVTFFLIAVVFYYRQNQKKIRLESQRAILYTRQLLEKTEEERKRIASDLHDSVSHELLSLKNTIHESNSSEKIDTIINDIRIISRNLHPVMFEKVRLAASLEQLVERIQSHYNLMVTTEIQYEDSFLSVSDELQVYRIVQEALSNTIKYAQAFAAKITLTTANDVLHLEIKDNGNGFDVAEKISGSTAFGLHNILERSKAIGGSAKIHSDKHGTVITIEIKKTT